MDGTTTLQPQGSGPGMPADLYLHMFGRIVWDAFGHPPYMVGSATRSKEWRDVDVRLILPDDEYEKILGPWSLPYEHNPIWRAHVLAYSALGSHMTGLPIDFQIQQQTDANARYGGLGRAGFHRNALGLCFDARVRGVG